MQEPTVIATIPHWHFSMLADRERNYAIEASIAASKPSGKVVLEIGTGVGLPAMLFAKYGATKVYTCEMDPALADIARKCIRENGFEDQITVISKASHRAIYDGDIPNIIDIIFTETLDCGVVGEGYVSVAEDIQRLARPETLILPSAIRQFAYLCNDPDTFSRNCVGVQNGLNLSALNRYSEGKYIPTNQLLHSPVTLSPIFATRIYDYITSSVLDDLFLEVIASSTGLCHGMISYSDAYFGNFVVTSQSKLSHWAQAFHPLTEPLEVKAGSYYALKMSIDGRITLGLIS